MLPLEGAVHRFWSNFYKRQMSREERENAACVFDKIVRDLQYLLKKNKKNTLSLSFIVSSVKDFLNRVCLIRWVIHQPPGGNVLTLQLHFYTIKHFLSYLRNLRF